MSYNLAGTHQEKYLKVLHIHKFKAAIYQEHSSRCGLPKEDVSISIFKLFFSVVYCVCFLFWQYKTSTWVCHRGPSLCSEIVRPIRIDWINPIFYTNPKYKEKKRKERKTRRITSILLLHFKESVFLETLLGFPGIRKL